MRKRVLGTALCASLLVGLCAGCGSDSDNAKKYNLATLNEKEETGGKVALTVWGASEDQKLLEKIIESFKEKHKGEAEFDITLAAIEEADCKGTILSNINESADVFSFADDQLRALAAAGVVQPIENQKGVKEASLEGAVDAASINDEMYAYPMTADNGYFLYYNKEYLKESDVETMDGMLQVLGSKQKKFTMDWTSGWYLYSFFANTGLTLGLNEDGITNYCTWNAKKGDFKGVDVAAGMLKISKNSAFMSGNDDVFVEGAKNGTVAAGVSGVWLGTRLKEVWGKNLAAVKLPTYTVAGKQVQMGSYTGYKLVGVNAYSKNYEWSSKLAEWIISEENEVLRFEMRGHGPANKKAAASDEIAKDIAIQGLLQQSEFGSLQRVGGRYWDPVSELGSTLSTGYVEESKLQHMLDGFVKSVTAQVD